MTVKAFGQIMDLLGGEQAVELPEGSTLEDLAAHLEQNLKQGGEGPNALSLLHSDLTVLVNGQNIQTLKSRVLKNGDYVAFLSPFGGG